MPWFAQLIVYSWTIFISFIALSNLEWSKISRTSRREYIWFTYIIIALVIGFLLGFFILNIVNIFLSINQTVD